MNKRLVGKSGEEYARDFLKDRGYKVLFENWTCQGGEIDLIMKRTYLVFVEVKYVRSNFCSPVDLFDRRKRNNLLHAIESFLGQNPEYVDNWRVDLVCVTEKYGVYCVDHYTDVL